jgi:hypothetical protein
MSEGSKLGVLIDGAPLDPEAARALWTEFSQHMDEHRGDMAGFAKLKGWRSVAPEYRQGKAVLVVRTEAAMPAQKAAKPEAQGKKKGPGGKARRPPRG